MGIYLNWVLRIFGLQRQWQSIMNSDVPSMSFQVMLTHFPRAATTQVCKFQTHHRSNALSIQANITMEWMSEDLFDDKSNIGSSNGPLIRNVKLRFAHAPGMPGTFSPPPRVGGPGMHHSTCVTNVPWCMPGSLTNGFLWSRWRGKCSRRMRNPQFCVSGKRPMALLDIVDQDIRRHMASLGNYKLQHYQCVFSAMRTKIVIALCWWLLVVSLAITICRCW